MGNRLVYGNYVEGYDFKTATGSKVNFEFTATTKSEDINYTTVPDNLTLGSCIYYNFTPATGHTQNVNDSEISIDFSSFRSKGKPNYRSSNS